jgi:hypothetical protein
MSMSSMLDLGKMLLLLCIAVLLGTQSRAALYHKDSRTDLLLSK